MFVNHNCHIGLRDVGQNNLLKNISMLSFLEDAGAIHSDIAGYGSLDIEKTNLSWVILGWKLKIIKRPKYGDKLKVKTWSSGSNKFYAFRDFEVYNKNEELIAIATSKWILIDTKSLAITTLSKEMLDKYEGENVKVFKEEPKYKIIEPKEYINSCDYIINRGIIDINKHVHNISYLDIAYEALPDEVYEIVETLNNIEISYKKEIKYGDKVKCFYSYENNEHIVIIKDESEKTIHAMIKLS